MPYDPVLDMSGPAANGAPARNQRARAGMVRAAIEGTGDVIDSTPRLVAGVMLGALGTLVLLRVAGFRFSWGVNIGAGS